MPHLGKMCAYLGFFRPNDWYESGVSVYQRRELHNMDTRYYGLEFLKFGFKGIYMVDWGGLSHNVLE